MSLKSKLALSFSFIVSVILILNTTLNYYSTRDLLVDKYKNQMELLVGNIAMSIENYQTGSKYIESMLGHEMRTASIAAKYALNADISKISNEQLSMLSKELDVSHITLFAESGNDIIGLKSSDPKEINLSTKDWEYWFTAFQQLLAHRNVTIPEGQKLANYWSGPFDVSTSDPNFIDKWGYFYDGTTNYIIDPYIRADSLHQFDIITGPDAVIQGILKDNPVFLEITGFNPKTFGKEPQKLKNADGVEFVQMNQRPILFGQYSFKDNTDAAEVNHVTASFKTASYDTSINGKHVIRSFVPIQAESPYVIGVVMDYQVIQDVLNQQLFRNMMISIILLIAVFLCSYFFSGFVVKPVLQILNKVKEISAGHFGVRISSHRKDELGLLAAGVNHMSSNLAEYKKQLEFQAYNDDLTELPNRRSFHERLHLAISEANHSGQQLALMFFDMDRFKSVNDIFGHQIGDRLLKSVGQRVSLHLRENDTLFRIGGDEFMMILPDITREEAAKFAEKIIHAVAPPFIIDGYEIYVTPSMGVSLYPDDADHAEALLKYTDIALYRAKDQGKNNYQFYVPENNEFYSRRLQLEKDLHKALENKEFVLYYQPQANMNTGQINGVEALVRWQHPELGLIAPNEFISLAEETGFIIPLGEWVLRTACKQMKAWHESGYPPMRIAVNLSARQFQQGNLAETVTEILKETRIDPQYLELEITESMAIQNSDYTIIKLQQLRQLGIQISMDDFGTGYSSLNYLRKFPINKLKIDKSFVSDIAIHPDNEVMIKTIITMAHHLKLDVIAEGVETREQLLFLKQEQCDEVQGYLFSKPISAEDFEHQFQSILEVAAEKI